MAEPLATYGVRITLRPRLGMREEEVALLAAAEPIGPANTEDVVGAFIPTANLLEGVLREVVQEATQLVANVTVERVDE